MPVRKSIREKMGKPAHELESEQKPAADNTAEKVSKLATATSICAFVAAACLIFAFVTHAQASAAIAEVKADLVDVVVAGKDIQKGTGGKADMVQVVQVPSKFACDGALSDASKAIGHQAVVKIEKNAQLRKGELTGNGNDSSLADKLAHNKKAVSIDVSTESDFACSLLHQGDRVSLFSFEEKSGSRTKTQLAKDVEVLALDGSLSYADLLGNGSKASYSNVTVAVDSATAEKVRETQDKGKTIWMVLTATVDTRK